MYWKTRGDEGLKNNNNDNIDEKNIMNLHTFNNRLWLLNGLIKFLKDTGDDLLAVTYFNCFKNYFLMKI